MGPWALGLGSKGPWAMGPWLGEEGPMGPGPLAWGGGALGPWALGKEGPMGPGPIGPYTVYFIWPIWALGPLFGLWPGAFAVFLLSYLFPRATSEGFLLCTSSAGAELRVPAGCAGAAAGLSAKRKA